MSDEIERCEHTVTDEDGIEGPCDRPATGWRWYQDAPHEDCLLPACSVHENVGGNRMHAAEAAVERARALVTCDPPCADCRQNGRHGVSNAAILDALNVLTNV